MNLDNLIIEVTRRCNMQCAHCLRGYSQNKDIKESYIEELFKKVEYISNLTITGGEPSLVPHKIKAIVKIARKYNVEIGSFYIATNGKRISNDFLISLIELYTYCSDNEISSVKVSNDEYHNYYEDKTEKDRLKVFNFVDFDDRTLQNENYLYEGLAEENGIGTSKPDNESIEIEGEYTEFISGDFYLNCNGFIIDGCDWSYKNQNKHKICHVSEFGLEAIRKYVNGIHNLI